VTYAPLGPDGIVQRVRLAAYAWCEADDAVLLVRVAPGYPEPGKWALPGGGLDFGEDPRDGLVRELEEETGLTGRVDDLVDIMSGVYEPEETTSGHRIHFVGILYRVTPTAGTLRDEPDGSTDHAAWIPIDRLETLPLVEAAAWARGAMGR
jgi:ADP-ribose pyrophosphatase YjhB (NUDIX family)